MGPLNECCRSLGMAARTFKDRVVDKGGVARANILLMNRRPKRAATEGWRLIFRRITWQPSI